MHAAESLANKTVKHKTSKTKARVKLETSNESSLCITTHEKINREEKLPKKRKSEEPWTIHKKPTHKRKHSEKNQGNEFLLKNTQRQSVVESETSSVSSTPEEISSLHAIKDKELSVAEGHSKYNNQLKRKSRTSFNIKSELSADEATPADISQDNEFLLKDNPQTLVNSETCSSSASEKILQTIVNNEVSEEIAYSDYNSQIRSNSWKNSNNSGLSTHKRKSTIKNQYNEFLLKNSPIQTSDESEACPTSSTPEDTTVLQTSVKKDLSVSEETGYSEYNNESNWTSLNNVPDLCEYPDTDSFENSTSCKHFKSNTGISKSCESYNSNSQIENQHLITLQRKCYSASSCTPFHVASKPLRHNKLFNQHSLDDEHTASEFNSAFSPRRFPTYTIPTYDVSEFEYLDNGYIDTHCHLDFLFQREGFKGTFEAYKRKNSNNFPHCFEGCIAVFCDPLTFENRPLWENLLKEDGIWAAFGCHPHNAKDFDSVTADILQSILKHPRVVALGEIGLDYSSRNSCDHKTQHDIFRKQLKLAVEAKLPVVIHCRDAHDDCIQILKEEVPFDYRIHRHCFTGKWKEAEIWLNTFPNLFLGITGLVTFPSARGVHDVVRRIPLDRLLLETDAPYFVPRHETLKDQKWSCPGMALHVAAQIAALRPEFTIKKILHETRKNTYKLYGC